MRDDNESLSERIESFFAAVFFAVISAPVAFCAIGAPDLFYDPFGHLPKSHGTIVSRSEVNYETWVPATRQEAESGVYEIKVYHGGRGTHQHWKRLKRS